MVSTKIKISSFAPHINEVESRILAAVKNVVAKVAKHKQNYLGTNNPIAGLTVPQQRQLLKVGYSFSKLPLDEQLLIWDAVWRQTKYHESKMQALYWLGDIKQLDKLIEFWPIIYKWVDHIDSWDTSDNLSSVFARILENDRHIVYPTLLKWNSSKNPWHRRQSIVSLLYYSSLRKTTLPHNQLLPLIENLIDDRDIYVQKGVGWSLRECHNVYPHETRKFIDKHALRISATAFSAAGEKWPKSFATEIKARRKKHRQSN